jgi:hypothetical protein
MDKDLDKILDATDKQFSKLNRLLYNTIIDYFVGGLFITDNKVELNDSNRRLVAALDRNTEGATKSIFTEFKRFIQGNILKYILKGLGRLSKIDVRAIETSDSVVDRVSKHSATVLETNLTLEKLYLEVKERSLRLISRPNGISLKELRDDLKDFVIEKGLADKYYKRWTYDIYSQYERVASNEVRKEIGLKYAIYQGGLIRDSRKFCIERNGRCYSEKEIESWEGLSWVGKPSAGYDAITDLGGYNCRHRLDWISDLLAYRLRPDLDPKNKGKGLEAKLFNDIPEKKKKKDEDRSQ